MLINKEGNRGLPTPRCEFSLPIPGVRATAQIYIWPAPNTGINGHTYLIVAYQLPHSLSLASQRVRREMVTSAIAEVLGYLNPGKEAIQKVAALLPEELESDLDQIANSLFDSATSSQSG